MDISKIREMARELNLCNVTLMPPEAFESNLPNVEYLDYILSTELRLRKEKNIIKQRKLSRFRKRYFSKTTTELLSGN